MCHLDCLPSWLMASLTCWAQIYGTLATAMQAQLDQNQTPSSTYAALLCCLEAGWHWLQASLVQSPPDPGSSCHTVCPDARPVNASVLQDYEALSDVFQEGIYGAVIKPQRWVDCSTARHVPCLTAWHMPCLTAWHVPCLTAWHVSCPTAWHMLCSAPCFSACMHAADRVC